MNDLIHADVFFFITSVFVVLLGAVLFVVLIRLAGLIKTLREISDSAKEEMLSIIKDVSDLRQEIRREAGRIKGAVDMIHDFFPGMTKVGNRKQNKSKK